MSQNELKTTKQLTDEERQAFLKAWHEAMVVDIQAKVIEEE